MTTTMKNKSNNRSNNNNDKSSKNNHRPSLLLFYLLVIGIFVIIKESNLLSHFSYSNSNTLSSNMSLEQKIEQTLHNDDDDDVDEDDEDDDEYVDYVVANGTTSAAKATNTKMKTKTKPRTETTNYIPQLLPSQMDLKYYEMWNHTTSTIDIPTKYNRYPFFDGIPSSLEILQNVLPLHNHHGDDANNENEKEYLEVDQYIINVMKKDSDPNKIKMSPPSCLVPNIKATRQIANNILDGTTERLSLPIFNNGFPKAGSTTLHEYFSCIGIPSNHGQNGYKMMQFSKEKKNYFFPSRTNNRYAFMQLDYSFGIGSYPQIQLLDELHEIYPSSTFVINFRPIQDWIRSISNWKSMRTRMALMDMPGLQLNKKQLEDKVQKRYDRYNGRGEHNLKQAYAILLMNETLSSNKTLDTTLMTHNEIRMYDHAKMLLQKPSRKAIVLRAALKAVTVAEAAAISNNTTNDDGDGMNNNNNNNVRRRGRRRKLKQKKENQK